MESTSLMFVLEGFFELALWSNMRFIFLDKSGLACEGLLFFVTVLFLLELITGC